MIASEASRGKFDILLITQNGSWPLIRRKSVAKDFAESCYLLNPFRTSKIILHPLFVLETFVSRLLERNLKSMLWRISSTSHSHQDVKALVLIHFHDSLKLRGKHLNDYELPGPRIHSLRDKVIVRRNYGIDR